VQFEPRLRRGLADGTIDVCFRRWRRRQVVAGNRYRSMIGLVLVEEVEELGDVDAITDADVSRAGYADLEALLADLRPPSDDTSLYRLVLRKVDEEDPRSLLAATAELTDDEREELDRRLDRLDRASKHGPWTRAVLRTIAERPAVRAADLAASFGRETAPFKLDVRKLKALGLTLSLEVGYRLSPRGEAYLRDSSGLPER
jgi:predicted transcriptional regulator